MADLPEVPHAHNALGSISALAKKRLFGIPVLFFALIAAAALLYYAIKAKPIEDAIDTADPNEFEGDESNTGVVTPIFQAGRNPWQPGAEETRTNAEWARDCISWLVQDGASYSAATDAITNYLRKHPLSMAERILVDKALAHFGPPPGGYISVPDEPPGGPVRQGNPPTNHTVRGNKDNNPKELTLLYYGNVSREAVRYLEANNPGHQPPWNVGTVIAIPLYRTPKYFKSTARINTAEEIARKNGTDAAHIHALNPGMHFPVPAGTKVRVQ